MGPKFIGLWDNILVLVKAILPEGLGFRGNHAFVRSRDMNLCFTSKSLSSAWNTLISEIPKHVLISKMKTEECYRSQMQAINTNQNQRKGEGSEDRRLQVNGYTHRREKSHRWMWLHPDAVLYDPLLIIYWPPPLCIGPGHPLAPSILQEDLPDALFSLMQLASIWTIPCLQSACSSQRLSYLWSGFFPARGYCKLQIGKCEYTQGSVLHQRMSFLIIAASLITLLRLLAKIVVSHFLKTRTPALEIKGPFGKSPRKLVVGSDLELVLYTPSLHCPHVQGASGSSQTVREKLPSR